MLPKYCSNIANTYDVKIGNVIELVSNLGSENKDVIHYRKTSVVFVIRNEIS